MVCTLDIERIPAEDAPTNAREWKNTDVLPVYDLENKGWRSIRLESIKTLSVITERDN
jgi:hypothetical protein